LSPRAKLAADYFRGLFGKDDQLNLTSTDLASSPNCEVNSRRVLIAETGPDSSRQDSSNALQFGRHTFFGAVLHLAATELGDTRQWIDPGPVYAQ
jgi:hypothetical protein